MVTAERFQSPGETSPSFPPRFSSQKLPQPSRRTQTSSTELAGRAAPAALRRAGRRGSWPPAKFEDLIQRHQRRIHIPFFLSGNGPPQFHYMLS